MYAHVLDILICVANGATLGGFGGFVSLYQNWVETKVTIPPKQALVELLISMVLGVLCFGVTNYVVVEFFSHKPNFFLAALVSCFGGWLGKRVFTIAEQSLGSILKKKKKSESSNSCPDYPSDIEEDFEEPQGRSTRRRARFNF